MVDNHEHLNEGGKPTAAGLPLSPFFADATPTTFGIAHLIGMEFERNENGGQVRVHVDGRLMHPQQIVHGGIIFTLADTAMSMALAASIPPGTPFGTIEAKINYRRPVRAGELVAEGRIVHEGGSTAVLEAMVYNLDADQKQAVAQVLGTFYIRRAKRSENDGSK